MNLTMLKHKNKIKHTWSERIFNLVNSLFMLLLAAVCIYPMYYVVMVSFSDAASMASYTGMLFKPLNFSLAAYKSVLENPMIYKGYRNTLFVLFAGLAVNLTMTTIAAYFFSRKNVKLKGPMMVLIVITMYFSGGTIPAYFNIQSLGLIDSLWALILPGAINTYNMIILRTSFASIPDALEESVKLDGGGHLVLLWKIIVPISKSALAVMVMYYGVAHWNSWFTAMLYLDTRELYPLQLILREMLIDGDMSAMTQDASAVDRVYLSVTLKYAVIVIATAPILCIYPFMQKYFVKGVMIGSVKG